MQQFSTRLRLPQQPRHGPYLISKERRNPATMTAEAQTLAANLGAVNCDWLLTAHRWKKFRSF